MNYLINVFSKKIFIYFAYKLVLDLVYYFVVFPIFGYSGYYLNFSISNILSSYILLIFLIVFIPLKNESLSTKILHLHLIIMYVPLLVLFAFSNLSIYFTFLACFCFLLQSVLVQILPNIKIKKMSSHIFGINLIALLFFLLTIVVYGYLLITQDINIKALDFEYIYRIRENLNLGNGVILYFITWQYRIINPIFIVYGFYRNNRKIMYLGIILQLVLFLITAQKEIIFSMFLILLCFIYSKLKTDFPSFFIYFLIFASLSSIVFLLFSSIPFSLITRLLFEPAKIKYQYFEFFTIHDKLMYSEGIVGKIFDIKYQYNEPIGFIIYNYFQSIGRSNSNTGFISYAYANSGVFGMIFMSFLFSFLLKLFDSIATIKDRKLIFSILIYPMIILNDGDLLTSMLTGGLFLLIIILMFEDVNFNISNKFKRRI